MKMVDNIYKSWPDKLLETLRVYRTTVRIVTQETIYSLVSVRSRPSAGNIAPIIKTAIQEENTNDAKANLSLGELVSLDDVDS